MWRRATIADAETLSDTEVWEYKLPTSGILSGILLHIENTNGGTDNLLNPIYKNINSIQLRDGGRTLFDVTGVQAEMISLIHSAGEPRSKFREAPSEVQTYQALIPFGLRLFDNDFGLNLANLKNPTLRVDIDFTNTRAVGASGFVSGSGNISGVLFINDGEDQPTPPAWVKSHEIKNWTTASSGDEVTQAPVDAPWIRMLLRAHVAGSCPDDVITDIKISFDSGQLVALDEKTKWQAHALPLILGRYPRFEFNVYRQDDETFDLEHASIQTYAVGTIDASEHASLDSIGCGNVHLSVDDVVANIPETVDSNRSISVWPVHPYMTVYYDFSEMGFLQAQTFQRADIVAKQGVASAAASIVLQQLIPNEV